MNFNMTNISWQRWARISASLTAMRKLGLTDEHLSNQGAIANKDYVCYLAQEWAGARK